MDLNTPVKNYPAVNETVERGLERLRIKKARQLLFYFPKGYEDRRKITKVSEATPGTQGVFEGRLKKVSSSAAFRRFGGKTKRMLVTKAVFEDDSGELPVVWFYQRFIERQYPSGSQVFLAGKPVTEQKKLILVSPEVERILPGKIFVHSKRIVPFYPETEGVSSRFLRYLIFRSLDLTKNLVEYLPERTREEEQLFTIGAAVRGIHFPDSQEELELSRKRLAFDELFILQLAALVRKKERTKEKSVRIETRENDLDEAKENLPFPLTSSQKIAVGEILRDFKSGIPMNRLLAGDVGSGKTVVAGLAALAVKKSGAQSALVAPTEILAQQHAASLSNLFSKSGLRVALLTGSFKKREKAAVLEKVSEGGIDLLVGTHALFHAQLSFEKLGLVIVDEQHRFGVEQRDELTKNGPDGLVPHFLSLTATPIPRTLQLTAYGDVDVTMLESRPGQQTVQTEVVTAECREIVYELLRKRMRSGEQVFVICPRVEEVDSEEGEEIKSVQSEYNNLSKKIFSELKGGMLHGKLPSDEKIDILEKFRSGNIDYLVASSVVEVGVDIPKATALLIEGADRFGLAQLHQFRGRVGRRGQKAVCYLKSASDDPKAIERLKVMENNNDGLKIAEEDLRRRGAGEIYGTRQSGGVKLRVANITDVPFLLKVRKAAENLLERDPALQTAELLNKRIRQLNVTTHFE